MFRYTICLIFFACVGASCGSAIKNEDRHLVDEGQAMNSTSPEKTVKTEVVTGNGNLIVKGKDDIIGYWVGMFEPDSDVGSVSAGEGFYWNYTNKINISIDKIENDQVWGHSVVAGNSRAFEGKMKFEKGCYSFEMKEPGDDKYDGQFTFKIDKGDSLLNGIWHAYKKVRVSGRKYTLQKMMFRYDPELQMDNGRYIDWHKKSKSFNNAFRKEQGDYEESYFTTTEDISKYNASAVLLSSGAISNLKKGDLFIMRNAIYARHGYSFKNQQLRVYFDQQPWYIPVSTDVKAEFTEIEKKNIELLLRYEKNAKEYYDVFGRG
jgi:hypothetical protein